MNVSLQRMFRYIVLSTLIGTSFVCALGLFVASRNENLTQELMRKDVARRISDQTEVWTASLALNQKDWVLRELRARLPEFEISDLELLEDGDRVRATQRDVLVLPDESEEAPYRMSFRAARRDQLPGQRYVVGLVLLLGFCFLFAALIVSWVFLKRFTKAVDVLNASIAAPLDAQPIEFPAGLGEFGLLVRKSFELRDRAQAAEKSRTLAKLSREVAHDIRSPLSALNIAVATINGLSEEHKQFIRAATDRINAIANDLLARYRANDSGPRIDARRTPQRLDTLLRDLYLEKKMEFSSRRDVQFSLDLLDSELSLAPVDRHHFTRALSNLVNNAFEAVGEGGRVQLALRLSDTKALVSVSDTGKGISPELLTRLGSNPVISEKSGLSGSGLGVFLAAEMTRSHGGEFSIQSSIGQGTTVNLALPL